MSVGIPRLDAGSPKWAGQLTFFLEETFSALQAERDQLLEKVKIYEDKIRYGEGSPESVVTAPMGTLYLRSDGGATTTLYVKTSGSGATGWTAK